MTWNSSNWDGLDPILRLTADRDYAREIARNSDTCGVCRNLDLATYPLAVVTSRNGVERREATLEHIDFFTSQPNIEDCGYCEMLLDAVVAFFPEFGPENISRYPRISSITMTENEPILLTVENRAEAQDVTQFGIEIYREPHVNVPSLPYLGTISSRDAQVSSSEVWLPFAKACIRECTDKHEWCNQSPNRLPTRIIDLVSLCENLRDYTSDVRVIHSSNLKDRYAALSHSWGLEGISFKLLTANQEGFGERVPFSQLPMTHRDAVVLCRKLGLRYLWIDSLCIIQDSVQDTQRETAVMGDIYNNAYLTIAAVSSPSSKVPFLQAPEEEYAPKPVRFYGSRMGLVLQRYPSLPVRALPPNLLARRTQRVAASSDGPASWSAPAGISDSVLGPLSKRAWTLQERALASRVIHFTSEGLKFECPTHFKAEDGRVSAPGYLSRWRELSSPNIPPMVLRTQLQRFWRQMLTDYTQRGITRRTDLLPALSGLAARAQSLHGADYIAGLWRDRLVEDLCWVTQEAKWNKAPPVHVDEKNVPSWSWVSVAHPTLYPIIDEEGHFTAQCEVMSCTANMQNSQWNRFGEVTSGKLVLRGPVRKALLTYAGQATSALNSVDFGAGSRSTLHEDARLISFEEEDGTDGTKQKSWRRAVDGEKSAWDKAEVWCLKVGTWTPKESHQVLTGVDLTFVMVLGKSSLKAGAFQRLGFLEGVYGGRSFDDVGGALKQFHRTEEIQKMVADMGIGKPYVRSAEQSRRLKELENDPGYSTVSVMEVTIV